MYLLAEALLAGVLLGGVLPFEVLLAAEGEMVLVVSVFLEKKEMIPPGLEIPEEEGALLLSGAFLCSGTLGTFSLLLTGLGGIGTCASGFCRCAGMLIQKRKFVSTSVTDVRVESV